VRSGSSYCSQSELPVTAGLGAAVKADAVTIRWPSGKVTELRDVAAGQILVNEDGGIVKQGPFGKK
jgi:enediyne biosynthesis protein E4